MPDMLPLLTTALSDRYRIEGEIGSGGMATVYLAQDLKHDRKVAVKVLKPELAAILGAERFLSEIKVTANLQHPHILPLHDSGEADGFLFYVMPYVEGESLRAKLDREKQLAVDEAVGVAKAVASALDYAHRHGVVHRDIKPANILLHDGQPMVADFGIALAVRAAGGPRITETGLSLGTPQYMSPEQASGDREVDGRTDLYSLGCVLYEMLTGEPPHSGPTVQAIIAKLLTDKPRPVTELRETVPGHVAATVHKALAKLPADRFEGAQGFGAALDDRTVSWDAKGFSVEGGSGIAAGASGLPRWAVPILLSVVVLLVALNAWSWSRPTGSPSTSVEKFTVGIPPSIEFLAETDAGLPFAFSRDGGHLVFAGIQDGQRQLFLRRLSDWEHIPISGTEGATHPTLSPDGNSVAFMLDGALYGVPVTGGEPTKLAALDGMVTHLSWGTHGYVVAGLAYQGLWQVPEDGGSPEVLTSLSTDDDVFIHTTPQVLPNGEGVLFTLGHSVGSFTTALLTFEDSVITVLPEEADGMGPRYVATAEGEFLLVKPYGTEDVMAVPFSLSRREVLGAPFPVLEGVQKGLFDGGDFAVSSDGTLAYVHGTVNARFFWVDRAGQATPLPFQPRPYRRPRVSPDGRRIAVEEVHGGNSQIFLYDPQERRTPLTDDGSNNVQVVWDPTGEAMAFCTDRNRPGEVYGRRVNAVEDAFPIASVEGSVFCPQSWSVQGTLVMDDNWDIWVQALAGDSIPTMFYGTPAREEAPEISPDDRWMAYASDKSTPGRYEIYVTEYPGPGDHRQVSVGGGRGAVWAWDSSELFYRQGDGMWAVKAPEDQSGAFGDPELLFRGRYLRNPGQIPNYAVAPDGRFLMMQRDSIPREIRIVKGWVADFAQRAGGGS